MQVKPYTSYNRYFLIPFIIWVVCGGIALLVFDKQELFSAINTHHTSFTDVLMLYVTYMGEGVFTALVLLILLARNSLKNWWYFTTAVASNVLPVVLIQSLKSGVGAPRPLKYFNEAEWVHILPEWPRLMERSFPSGHTCAAFCLFTTLAFLLPFKYQKFGLLFCLLGLVVGYSRLYLAAHFFLDVYVGSIIGVLFTIFVFAVMNRYEDKFFRKAG